MIYRYIFVDRHLSAFSASAAKIHTNPLCDAQQTTENKKQPTLEKENDLSVNEATEAIVEDELKNLSTKVKNAEIKKIGCVNCFSVTKAKKCKNRDLNTPEMSEVYCPSCDKDDAANASPECLDKITTKSARSKPRSLLGVESELIINRRGSLRLKEKKPINRSASLSAADRLKTRIRMEKEQQKERKEKQLLKEKEKENKKISLKPKDSKEKLSKTSNLLSKLSPKKIRIKSTMSGEAISLTTNTQEKKSSRSVSDNNKNQIELLTKKAQSKNLPKDNKSVKTTKILKSNNKKISVQEYEIADDATSLNGEDFLEKNDNNSAKMAVLSDNDKKLMISVHGREELPQTTDKTTPENNNPYNFEKCVPVEYENRPIKAKKQNETGDNMNNVENSIQSSFIIKDEENNVENNNDTEDFEVIAHETIPMLQNKSSDDHEENALSRHLATLPRTAKRGNRALDLVPKRRTRDGTNIYYWCDLPKKVLKELDDGAYNPLWASRGFTQTYHFWKEHRRAQCVPLNAFLTYVTLPWWSIAKDLLDHRETPILTF